MNEITKNALLKAYINLQQIVEDLYVAADKAVDISRKECRDAIYRVSIRVLGNA
jgi:hypothetical protein